MTGAIYTNYLRGGTRKIRRRTGPAGYNYLLKFPGRFFYEGWLRYPGNSTFTETEIYGGMVMRSTFNGNNPGNSGKSDFDFLQDVFEWVFYSLPPRADNSFIRNMYEFYKTRGGLSRKQLTVLLNTINSIDAKPPFSPATLEAIIKKKAVRSKAPLPPAKPLYQDDPESRQKLEKILSIAPAHKAALLYLNKLNLHQPLSAADKDSIGKFLARLTERG